MAVAFWTIATCILSALMDTLPSLSISSELLNDQVCFFSDSFPSIDGSLFLSQPHSIFTAHCQEDVNRVLHHAEKAAQSGYWVAGFLAYEAACAWGLPVLPPKPGLPLVWMAAFSEVHRVVMPDPLEATGEAIGKITRLDVSFSRYLRDLQEILSAIDHGETYQVNHTVMADVAVGDPGAFFLRLQGLHRFPYGSWLNFGTGRIASFSPELFIVVNGSQIVTAPIKGTRPRVEDVEEDQRLGQELEASAKDRAEHIMIVDMARNDLGRICRIGTVRAKHLFERRSFSTIHHLETRITGSLVPNLGLPEIMASMFPAASITGAPKRRTMEIIRKQEDRPRGVYTGSLGILAPGTRRWNFNVAIRTVTWLGQGVGKMGLGGGIVADSDARAEWQELSDKGRFLEHPPKPFGLIETCFVDSAGTIPRLSAHVERLAHSAMVLGFPCDQNAIAEKLRKHAKTCTSLPRVVRLVLEMGGRITITDRDFVPPQQLITAFLAPVHLDRSSLLLQHKTTRRELFDHFFIRARERGGDDCLFINALDRVTEGAIRAIAVRLPDGWVVPPRADGLLPSLWRREFMESHEVRERSLGLEDLARALEIRMGNAVGGGVVVARIVDHSGKVIYSQRSFFP